MMLLLISILTTISIFIIYEKNNPNTFKLLSIGDGLSLGLNPLGIESYNYNDYIKEYLMSKNKNLKYLNYSYRNISIKELTNDIIYLNNKELKDYIKTSNLIIVSIGEKELLDNNTNNIKEDLNNLIVELKKYNNNIYLLGRYKINKHNIKEINNIYKEVSKNNNIVYIDINNNDYYLKNKYKYPTTNGYKEIAKMIIKSSNR